MITYPHTIEEFKQMFHCEDDCIRYLFEIRKQLGFVCPSCGNGGFWIVNERLYECQKCHRQTSAKAGTVFQDSKQSLLTWFNAIWLFVTQKNGASAKGIQQGLGLRSYQTAWTMLQKLRTTMVRSTRTKLSGTIEVDESYLGGSRKGKRGRGAVGKTLVAVAVELKAVKPKEGKEIKDYYRKYRLSRVRLQCIPDTSKLSLHSFVKENIEPGSTVITDGYNSYNGLEDLGYEHVKHSVTNAGSPDEELPHVHLAISLLDRWMLGTLQGGSSKKHMQAYLDEFVFRFNRKTSRHRGLLFYRILECAVTSDVVTYRDIVDKC
jgi:transposase-like protein